MGQSYVFVQQLTVLAIIGIHAHERVTPQRILIDLKVSLPEQDGQQDDHIDATLDYTSLCTLAEHTAVGGQFQLVETLAEHIADAVQQRYRPAWCEVRVAKPDAVAAAQAVGVVITRSR